MKYFNQEDKELFAQDYQKLETFIKSSKV